MPATWKTVRVFISSTFRDMQAERDHLVRFVFPRMREQLLSRRIHLVDVDLRWGVTGEQDASDVCREIIDECRPRFLCMLGGRYGTVPEGKEFSITAGEVHFGALDAHGDKIYALFYFRHGAVTELMDKSSPGSIREPRNSGKANELARLKRSIRKTRYSRFLYRPRWSADEGRLLALKTFGDRVERDLLATINDELGVLSAISLEELDEENAAMEAFIEERTERFVLGSRETVLEDLLVSVNTAGGDGYDCLVGAPGSGKSALLAYLSRHEIVNSQASTLLIRHFVGASPGSTDVRMTLRRFCRELKAACPDITSDIPDDPEKLRLSFPAFLRQAGTRQRVVILLDAVNQLDKVSHDAELHWLPEELPANTHVILSLPEGPALEELRRRDHKPREIELRPLTTDDRDAIVEQFQKRYRKTFEPEQRAALVSKSDAGMPLYLRAALEELRTLGGYDEITRRIAELPPTTHELFGWMLARLERDGGFRDARGRRVASELVPRFSALLGASRYGLSERELAGLLDMGDPQGNVAALQHLLRPYLMRRGELLDFYHGQLREATEEKWLKTQAQHEDAHSMIAAHLAEQWRNGDRHALSELPYHRLKTCRWSEVAAGLIDVLFLDRKCGALGIDNVLTDFIAALDALPDNRQERAVVSLVYATLDRQAHILRREAGILPQVLHNELVWTCDRDSVLWRSIEKAVSEPEMVLLLDAKQPITGESRALRTIKAPSEKLARIVLSPDGRWLAGACGDLGTCIWEAQTGILRRVLATEHSHDLCLAFNSDGTTLATGGWWSCLRIWDFVAGALVRSVDLPDFVEDLVYSAAWGTFVLVSTRGTVYILDEGKNSTLEIFYEAPSFDPPKNLPEFLLPAFIAQRDSHRIARIAVAPDGDFSAAAEVSGVIGIADMTGAARGWVFTPTIDESEVEGMLPQFRLVWDGVTSVAFSPDGKSLVSTHRSFRWRMWDLRSSTPVQERRGHRASVVSLAFQPGGGLFATGGEDGEVHLWHSASGQKAGTIAGHFGFLVSLQFSPDGNCLYSAADDGTIKVWDVRPTAHPPRDTRNRGHSKIVYGARFSSGARFLASWAEDFSLRVWRVADMHVEKAEEFNWFVLDVAFSPDERLCAVASKAGSVFLYDTSSWKVCRILRDQTRGARCVEFSPDGMLLAVGDDDGHVCFWNVRNGNKEMTHHLQDLSGVESLSFAADGSELYVAAGTNALFVCSIKGFAVRKVTPKSDRGARQVVRSMSKSRRIVASNSSGTLEMIDSLTGSILLEIVGPIDPMDLKSLTVSADDRYVIAAAERDRVEVWSVDTGARVGVFHCEHQVLALHVHRGTGRLFTADHGGSSHIPIVHELRIAEPAPMGPTSPRPSSPPSPSRPSPAMRSFPV